MSKLMRIFVFSAFLISMLQVHAQGNCDEQTINAALKNLLAGNFSMVSTILLPCIPDGFDDLQQSEAFRIMAIKCLAQDSVEAARKWAELWNNNKSGAEFSDENQQFVKLIKEIRKEIRLNSVMAVSKKLEKIQNAAASVVKITEEDINRRGYTNLEELFSDLPGFDVSRTYSATLSNLYMRGYRSGSTRGFLFMINNIEANDIWSNTALISKQYPITNVKCVEVVYGPASSIHGPNALMGVVNIITKAPEDLTQNNFPGIIFSMGNGSFNTRSAELTMAAQDKNIGFMATARRFTSDEHSMATYSAFDFDTSFYNAVDYARLLGITSNAAAWARQYKPGSNHPYFQLIRSPQGDTTAVNLTTRGVEIARELDKTGMLQGVNSHRPRYTNLFDHWFIDARVFVSGFTVGFEFWKYKQGVMNAYTDQFYASAINGNLWGHQQATFFIRYNKIFSEKISFNSQSSYRVGGTGNETRLVYIDNYSNGAFKAADLMVNASSRWNMLHLYQMSQQVRSETSLLYNPCSKLSIISGFEIKQSFLPGNYRILLNPSADQNVIEHGYFADIPEGGSSILEIREAGIFSQINYRIDKWLSFQTGGRLDYHSIKAGKGHGVTFNPKLAIVANRGRINAKAFFATSHQNFMNDLEFFRYSQRMVSNQETEPQRNYHFEISAGYKFDANVFADIAIFRYIMEDFEPGKANNLPDNIQSSNTMYKVAGVQTGMRYQWNRFLLQVNYSWCLPKQHTFGSDKIETGKLRIGDIASHRLNLSFDTKVSKKVHINFRLNYSGQRKTGPNTTVASNLAEFPAVALLSTTITYTHLLPGLNIQLKANNLLDTKYSHPGIYSADGSYFSSCIPQPGRAIWLRATYDLKSSFK